MQQILKTGNGDLVIKNMPEEALQCEFVVILLIPKGESQEYLFYDMFSSAEEANEAISLLKVQSFLLTNRRAKQNQQDEKKGKK